MHIAVGQIFIVYSTTIWIVLQLHKLPYSVLYDIYYASYS